MANTTEWDFYFCTIEDKPASIMVDLALKSASPIADKAEFIQISVSLRQPNEHGLTTPAEAETLYVMEDRLAEHLAQNLQGVYAGRNTHNGKRIFYFYTASAIDYAGVVAEVMDSFPTHTYELENFVDPEWAFFEQFLFPSQVEYQSILNRRVLEKLKENGLTASDTQEVEHFLYFYSETAREMFLERIAQDNFRVIGKGYTEASARPPYSLVLVREDKMDTQTIDAVVLYLIQAAEHCQGEYDGWGTAVAN
ncbi:MAG: DUF695 domain-containing protein [Bacteroidota bacterium]